MRQSLKIRTLAANIKRLRSEHNPSAELFAAL
jgi:hypothetical protein